MPQTDLYEYESILGKLTKDQLEYLVTPPFIIGGGESGTTSVPSQECVAGVGMQLPLSVKHEIIIMQDKWLLIESLEGKSF